MGDEAPRDPYCVSDASLFTTVPLMLITGAPALLSKFIGRYSFSITSIHPSNSQACDFIELILYCSKSFYITLCTSDNTTTDLRFAITSSSFRYDFSMYIPKRSEFAGTSTSITHVLFSRICVWLGITTFILILGYSVLAHTGYGEYPLVDIWVLFSPTISMHCCPNVACNSGCTWIVITNVFSLVS